MLYGTVPFKATNMGELQKQIITLDCSWGTPGEISKESLAFLKKVLEVDPKKRLSPAEILTDPWMYLSDKQIKAVEVFSTYEKEKIVNEFEYYNTKKEGVDPADDPF